MRERQSNKQLNLLNMYRNIKISKIELKNASGTVCSLECYYKVGKDDKPKRIGSTGNFPLGQIKTPDLTSLKDLPEGAWVTAYRPARTA